MNQGAQDKLLYRVCEHIKDNGIRCGQPAVSGEVHCRLHLRARTTMSPTDAMYELPVLETDQSVQLALQQLTRAVLSGKLSERKAAVLLAAIKTAANMVRQRNDNRSRDELLNELAAELRERAGMHRSQRKSHQTNPSTTGAEAIGTAS